MEDLKFALDAYGIELPTPAYLTGVLLFGVIGLVAFYVGRRRKRRDVRWLGAALMLYPYVVWDTALLYGVGVALTAVLAWRWSGNFE